MTGGGRALVRRVPFTASYAVLLAVVSAAVHLLNRGARTETVHAVSTNIDNLGAGHVETLLTSALVQAEPGLPLLLAVVAALAAAEVVLGWRRTLIVFVVGHVGATLLVAAALAVGALPGVAADHVQDAVDTGPSYGTAAVVGAGLLVATVRALRYHARRGTVRGAATGVALIVVFLLSVGALATQPTFTAWGHLVALLSGALAGVLLARAEPGPGAVA